jgi:hypothetical protein
MPPPTGPATAPESARGGERRMSRIIAQGFVASIPAGPVPIAPRGLRLLREIGHASTNARRREFVFSNDSPKPN